MIKREITELDKALLNPNKTVGWNIFYQFGVDLDQILMPGVLWNVSAFYAPEEVQKEFEEWVLENWKTIAKAHDEKHTTKKAFERALQYTFLDIMPSSNKENAAKEQLQVYVDIPSAPTDNTIVS